MDIKPKKSRGKSINESLSLEIAQNISHFEPTTIDAVHSGIGAAISVSVIASGPALFLSSLSSDNMPAVISALGDISRLCTPQHRSSLATYFKPAQTLETLLKLTTKSVFRRKESKSSIPNSLLESVWTHLFETANLSLLERVHADLPSQLIQTLAPSKKKYLKGEIALKNRLMATLSQVSAIRSGTAILPSMCTMLAESLDLLISIDTEDKFIKEKSTFVVVIMRVIVAFDPRVRPWLYEHGKVIEVVTKILQSAETLDYIVVSQSLEVVKFFGSEYADRLAALNYPSIAYHVSSTSPNLSLQDACRNLLSQMWPKSEQNVGIWKELLTEYKLLTDEMHRAKVSSNILNMVEMKMKSEADKLEAALTLLEPHELAFASHNILLFSQIWVLMKPSYSDILTPKYFNTMAYCMSSFKCPIDVVRKLVGHWQAERPSHDDLRSRSQRPTALPSCYTDGFTSKKMPDNRHMLSPEALALLEAEESLLLESGFFNSASNFANVDATYRLKVTLMLWNQPPLLRAVLRKSPLFIHTLIDMIPKQAHAASSLIMLQALLIEAHTDDDFNFDSKTSIEAISSEDERTAMVSVNLRFYALVSSLIKLPEICAGTGLRNLLRSSIPAPAIDLPIAMMAHRVFELTFATFSKLDAPTALTSLEEAKFENTLALLNSGVESVTQAAKVDELETLISGPKPATAKHSQAVVGAGLTDLIDIALFLMRVSISLGWDKPYKISVLLSFSARIHHSLHKPLFAPFWTRLVNYKWSSPTQDLSLFIDPSNTAPKVYVNNGLTRAELGAVLRNLLAYWLYTLRNVAVGSISAVLARFVEAAKHILPLFGKKLGLACKSLFFDLALEYSRRAEPLPLLLAEVFFTMFTKHQEAQKMLEKGLTGPGSFDDPDTGILDPSDGALQFEQPHFVFTVIKESLLHIAAPPHDLEAVKTKAKALRSAIDSIPKLRFYLLIHSVPNASCSQVWAGEYLALARQLETWSEQQIEKHWTAVQPLLDAYYIPHLLEASPTLARLYSPIFSLLPLATLGTNCLVPLSRAADNSKVSLAVLRSIIELALDLLIVLPSNGRLSGSGEDKWLPTLLNAPDEAIVNRAAWLAIRYTLPSVFELEKDPVKQRVATGAEAFFDLHIKNALPNLLLYPAAFTTCFKLLARRIQACTNFRPPSKVPIADPNFLVVGQLTNAFWFYSRHAIDLAYCDDDAAAADWFDIQLTACKEAAAEGSHFTPDGWCRPLQPRPMMHIYEQSKIDSEAKYGPMKRDWIANQRPNLLPTNFILEHLSWYSGVTQQSYVSTKGPKMKFHSGGQMDQLANGLFISEHKIHRQLPEERKTLHRRDLILLEMMDLAGSDSSELLPLRSDCEDFLANTRRVLADVGLESLTCSVAYENHTLTWIHTDYESGEDLDRLNLAIKLASEAEKDKKQLSMEAEKEAILAQAKDAQAIQEEKPADFSIRFPGTAARIARVTFAGDSTSSGEDSELSDDEDDITASYSARLDASTSVESEEDKRWMLGIDAVSNSESPRDIDTTKIDLPHLKLMTATTFQQLFGALEVLIDAAYRYLEVVLPRITFGPSTKTMDPSLTSCNFERSAMPIDSWLSIAPVLVGANHYQMSAFEAYDSNSYILQEFIPSTFYWKWLHLMSILSPRLPHIYLVFCRQLTLKLMQNDIAEPNDTLERIPEMVFAVVAEFGCHSCNPLINSLAPRLFSNNTETLQNASSSISAATEAPAASSYPSLKSGSKLSDFASIVDPSISHATANETARGLAAKLKRAGKGLPEYYYKPSHLFFFDDLSKVPSYVIHYLPLLLDEIDLQRIHSSALHARLLRLVPKFVTVHCPSQLFELAQFGLDQHNIDLPHLRDLPEATSLATVAGDYGRLIASVITKYDDLERFVKLMPLASRSTNQIKVTIDASGKQIETPISVDPIGGADFICSGVDTMWTFAAILRVATPSFLQSFFSMGATHFKALWTLFSLPDRQEGRFDSSSVLITYFTSVSFRGFMMMLNILPDLMTLHDVHNQTFAQMREREIEALSATPAFAQCNIPPARPFYKEYPESFTGWDLMPPVLTSTFVSHPSVPAATAVWLLSRHWGADPTQPTDPKEIFPDTPPRMWPLVFPTGLNAFTIAGYPRLLGLDRKLRMGTSVVQQRLGNDLYPETWYAKGLRVYEHEAALPSVDDSTKKPSKKEKLKLSFEPFTVAPTPIANNNIINNYDDDADFRAAIQASLDPRYNLPDSLNPKFDDRSCLPLVPTVTLRRIIVSTSQYAPELVTIAIGSLLALAPERFKAEVDFLTSCNTSQFMEWCLRELNVVIGIHIAGVAAAIASIREALAMLELTPSPDCTALGPVWRIRALSRWNYGQSQLRITKGAGETVDTSKMQVVADDRVNTVYFEKDSITVTSAPSHASDSKASERKLRKKKSSKKTSDAELSPSKLHRSQKEPEDDPNIDEKAPSIDLKRLSGQKPTTWLNFWIGHAFLDNTPVSCRREPHCRIGYATKEALEHLNSQPLLAIGDVPGSWAVDSMTGCVFSEGLIHARDISSGSRLLSRPSEQDQLFGLSFDEFSNEFTVKGLLPVLTSESFVHAQQATTSVPLPFAESDSEPRVLYPCISFFNDRGFALFRNKNTVM